MSILRKQPRTRYTVISNDLLEDNRLSLRAVGLAALLLSKPDNWVIRMEYLAGTRKESLALIRGAMKELAIFGYCKPERPRDESGGIRTVTYLADYPAFENDGTPESRINGYEPQDTGRD